MSDKIPKIIHCCWLSGEAIPDLYKRCVESWKQCMPDYTIMLWDTTTFDINTVAFVKQAVKEKKWAFAADYIRFFALYHFGGIYLDMDVMVYKSFDPFLKHRAFSSIEYDPRIYNRRFIQNKIPALTIEAAVLGAEKEHIWIKECMDFYKDKEFINNPKYYWNMLLPRIMSDIAVKKFGFRLIPVYQVLDHGIHLYPPDVFSSCYDLSITRLDKSENKYELLGEENNIRYALHICAHSWWEGIRTDTLMYQTKKRIIQILGKKNTSRIKKIFALN